MQIPSAPAAIDAPASHPSPACHAHVPRFWVAATLLLPVALLALALQASAAPHSRTLSASDYLDRVRAIWTAQMIAQMTASPYEHQPASALSPVPLVPGIGYAGVDDDYYYEMVAIRAFERYGLDLSVQQLGEQWLRNSAGSWGSSEQTRLLLARGIVPPLTGHPRYNRLWWTIGAQFSSDVYGALSPGLPNQAAALARNLGHINSYAEGNDGAVFVAGMVSLAFFEKDTHSIVRQAANLIAPASPYRQCLDLIVQMAETGATPAQIASAIDRRYGIEYPATNNAVLNGGIVAISVWFGQGDFVKTLDLASTVADFTDADCNAANSASVVAAMHGMAALPPNLVAAFNDRIVGNTMGDVVLTPPVNESISELAARTAAIGEKLSVRSGVRRVGTDLTIPLDPVKTQPAELFDLEDLGHLWNPEWSLQRAGYGGSTGGIAGIRGATYLDGEVLATFPRDEVRGTLLCRKLRAAAAQHLSFQAGVDPGRTWHLEIFVDNKRVLDRLIDGTGATDRHSEEIALDLTPYAERDITIRLYDLILVPNHLPGNAYWKGLRTD